MTCAKLHLEPNSFLSGTAACMAFSPFNFLFPFSSNRPVWTWFHPSIMLLFLYLQLLVSCSIISLSNFQHSILSLSYWWSTPANNFHQNLVCPVNTSGIQVLDHSYLCTHSECASFHQAHLSFKAQWNDCLFPEIFPDPSSFFWTLWPSFSHTAHHNWTLKICALDRFFLTSLQPNWNLVLGT